MHCSVQCTHSPCIGSGCAGDHEKHPRLCGQLLLQPQQPGHSQTHSDMIYAACNVRVHVHGHHVNTNFSVHRSPVVCLRSLNLAYKLQRLVPKCPYASGSLCVSAYNVHVHVYDRDTYIRHKVPILSFGYGSKLHTCTCTCTCISVINSVLSVCHTSVYIYMYMCIHITHAETSVMYVCTCM